LRPTRASLAYQHLWFDRERVVKYRAVIFDLGNTLVSYFDREGWAVVLDKAIAATLAYLQSIGKVNVELADLPARVLAERGERPGDRVDPLINRLMRIFGLTSEDLGPEQRNEMCRAFMVPVFAEGRRYDDALPVLCELRRCGLRTAVLSNSPWGSPPELWRREVARHGLAEVLDEVVFCGDAGYRKPAIQAFDYTTGRLGLEPRDCVFVGDDPRWDVVGPARVGMDAVLIVREGERPSVNCPVIGGLAELLPLLQAPQTATGEMRA